MNVYAILKSVFDQPNLNKLVLLFTKILGNLSYLQCFTHDNVLFGILRCHSFKPQSFEIYAEVEHLKAGLGRLRTAQLVVDDIVNLLVNNVVKYDKIFTVFQVFFTTV